MSIINDASRGIKWVSLARFSTQGLQFITLIILAKFLEVVDFGLMSTAMIYLGLLQVIYDLGISSALIQKDEISKELFSSVVWLNIAFGISLAIIMNVLSPIIAEFHHENELEDVIKVLSIVFIISSITSAQRALFEKNLKFNTISRIEIVSSFLGAIVGISLAVSGYGVWSLVFQSIVIALLNSSLIWFYSEWKPEFFFSLKEIRSVLKFSVNLSGFNIVNYFVRNADNFLVSRYLGVEALGFYSMAYKLMLYPLQNISQILSRVMYPIYSKLKHDNKQFKDVYILVIKGISLITFPMMLGLMSVSDIFVKTVLGEKWMDIVPLVLVLSPVGLIQSVYTPAGSIFQAKSKTDVWFKWGVLSGITTIIAFIIGLKWGLLGVAVSYFIVNIVLLYPGIKIPFKYIELQVPEYFKVLWKTFLCSMFMAMSIIIVNNLKYGISDNRIQLIILITLGVAIYSLVSYLFNKENVKVVYALLFEGNNREIE